MTTRSLPAKRRVKPPPAENRDGLASCPSGLKTAGKRTPSQQAWLSRQINDPFAAKAAAPGIASPAA